MSLTVVNTPLLRIPAEAIVNRANMGLQYSSGLCGEIFDAAGKLALQRACCSIGSCSVGEAVVTEGFSLPAKYIIHAVPPRWCGGKYGEDRLLAACYENALKTALALGVHTVAFPLLSEERCGYPSDRGEAIARASLERLASDEIQVYLSLPKTVSEGFGAQ